MYIYISTVSGFIRKILTLVSREGGGISIADRDHEDAEKSTRNWRVCEIRECTAASAIISERHVAQRIIRKRGRRQRGREKRMSRGKNATNAGYIFGYYDVQKRERVALGRGWSLISGDRGCGYNVSYSIYTAAHRGER